MPDPEIFGDARPRRNMLRQVLFDAVHLFPGLRMRLDGERFCAPGGLKDWVEMRSQLVSSTFSFQHESEDFSLQVAASGSVGPESPRQWHSRVNGIQTSEGGSHIDGFCRNLADHPELQVDMLRCVDLDLSINGHSSCQTHWYVICCATRQKHGQQKGFAMRFDVDFNQAPLLVIWEVTRSCALACRHCRAEAIMGRHPDELSLAQGKQLLDDIKDMGTPLVVFTGGDPLQREDLDDLITYASSIGLRVGGIPATTELLTRDRVQRLKDAGLDQMAISIDAPNAEAHDGFRRVPGAFAKALEGAGWAREVGMPLQVNTVFASWNFEYFEQMAQLVQDLGVVFWEVFFLVPVGRGTVMESCTAQQHEELFAKLQKLSNKVDFVIKVTEAPHYRAYLARQGVGDGHLGAEGKGIGSAHHRSGGAIRRSKTGVNSGKGFCFVDHTGNVNPSGFLPIEAGNVKEQTITSIYRDSPLFRELRNPALLKGV